MRVPSHVCASTARKTQAEASSALLGSSSVVDAVIGLVVLLVSVIIHENAHGVAALALGDDTAKKAGRITLNPIKHLDIVGSLIIPLGLFFAGGPMFGYAKPVPVTPSKLKGTDRAGFAAVAAAGPISNLVLVFIAATLLKSMAINPLIPSTSQKIVIYLFEWNLVLAAFNLLPIPPLDGSRFLRLFLNTNGRRVLDRVEPFGFLILFLLLFQLSEPMQRLIGIIERVLLRLLPI
jgi:Zn-dependent protease